MENNEGISEGQCLWKIVICTEGSITVFHENIIQQITQRQNTIQTQVVK
jgi:hypothetical protein